MDCKAILDKELYERVKHDFNSIETEKGVSFRVWTVIPEEYLNSYYLNEISINPLKQEFEQWVSPYRLRNSPIYSVALYNEEVVSSLCSIMSYDQHVINLWSTHESYRSKHLGKGVLLNCLIAIFENRKEATEVYAWDITSEIVFSTLTKYGFQRD